MDPYNRRKAAGGRTITVRLNAEDGALLDALERFLLVSKEEALRVAMRRMHIDTVGWETV